MKCIRNNSTLEIKRVSEENATYQVSTGKFSFAKKQDWKAQRAPVVCPLLVVSAVLDPVQEREIVRRAEAKKQRMAKKNGHKITK